MLLEACNLEKCTIPYRNEVIFAFKCLLSCICILEARRIHLIKTLNTFSNISVTRALLHARPSSFYVRNIEQRPVLVRHNKFNSTLLFKFDVLNSYCQICCANIQILLNNRIEFELTRYLITRNILKCTRCINDPICLVFAVSEITRTGTCSKA